MLSHLKIALIREIAKVTKNKQIVEMVIFVKGVKSDV